MLLLGGSAVVNALTGVNIYAASFLIPLGVVVYTLAGGLKATFLASYIHSVIGNAPLCNVIFSFIYGIATIKAEVATAKAMQYLQSTKYNNSSASVVLAEASMGGFINASAIVKAKTASTKGMQYLKSVMYNNSSAYCFGRSQYCSGNSIRTFFEYAF